MLPQAHVQADGRAIPAGPQHIEDNGILGAGPDGIPLLTLIGAASVLCVPLPDGEQAYGVLTLARQPGNGCFGLADVGLVEEIAEQLALAMSVRLGAHGPHPGPGGGRRLLRRPPDPGGLGRGDRRCLRQRR